MLGKIEDKRRRVQQRIRWIDSITNSVDMNLSKLWEIVKDRKAWYAGVHGLQRIRHDLVAEQQQQQISNSLHRWRENSQLGVRYEEILRMQNSKMKENMKEVGKWKTEQEDPTSNSNFRRRKIKGGRHGIKRDENSLELIKDSEFLSLRIMRA